MRVGDKDILIPTMMVGNYPKPRWYNGQAYATVPQGNFVSDSVSYEAFEDCVAAIVSDQERAGIDVISDGRVYGGDTPYAGILYYFTDRMKGYQPYGPALQLPQYSTMYSPTCDGPIKRKVPWLSAQLKAVKKFTDKPVKMQYLGLAGVTMGTNNEHYEDIKDLSFALAKAYNEEFKQISAEGAAMIQLDEFAWHYGLRLGEWENDVFNAAVEGVEAKILTHVCWGNFMGTKGYLPSGPMHGDNVEREGTEYVAALRDAEGATQRSKACFPRAHAMNMDVLNFEIGNTGSGDLKPLAKANWERDFVAGVIDVRSLEVEPASVVADRIRDCLEVVPAERLGVTTDCGLINVPRMIAFAKLRALVEGTKIVREEIKAKQAAEAGVSA
jgi:5-methyltetrahydropteroyltriglutamate--homocysteine methyltransferase